MSRAYKSLLPSNDILLTLQREFALRNNNPAASATPGSRDRLAARFSSEGHGALKGVKEEGDMEQIRRNREIFGSNTPFSRYLSIVRFKSRA